MPRLCDTCQDAVNAWYTISSESAIAGALRALSDGPDRPRSWRSLVREQVRFVRENCEAGLHAYGEAEGLRTVITVDPGGFL